MKYQLNSMKSNSPASSEICLLTLVFAAKPKLSLSQTLFHNNLDAFPKGACMPHKITWSNLPRSFWKLFFLCSHLAHNDFGQERVNLVKVCLHPSFAQVGVDRCPSIGSRKCQLVSLPHPRAPNLLNTPTSLLQNLRATLASSIKQRLMEAHVSADNKTGGTWVSSSFLFLSFSFSTIEDDFITHSCMIQL